jgi:hypothetical protein
MYDVNEIEHKVHQNDQCFDNEHEVLEGDLSPVSFLLSNCWLGPVVCSLL